MTLDEAVTEFERGRVVVDAACGPVSPTGELYAEILSGSLAEKGEGEFGEYVYGNTESISVEHWLLSAQRYGRDRTGTLYWRVRPEMAHRTLRAVKAIGADAQRVYAIYSRLLISDRPAIAVAA